MGTSTLRLLSQQFTAVTDCSMMGTTEVTLRWPPEHLPAIGFAADPHKYNTMKKASRV